MLVDTLLYKIKQRINKVDSQDYDNIENHVLLDYYNKAQLYLLRETLKGSNQKGDGDEGSKINLNSFQKLIVDKKFNVSGANKTSTFYHITIPNDYYLIKRIDIEAEKDGCIVDDFVVYFCENYMTSVMYNDPLKCPNFEWRETFYTLSNDEIKVFYKNFDINKIRVTYYRLPAWVEKNGVFNTKTGAMSVANVPPDFEDDVVELMIDYTAALIGGDIQDVSSYQIHTQNKERTS